jgi:hypothetical protein
VIEAHFQPDRVSTHRLSVRPKGSHFPWRVMEFDATARHLAAAMAEHEGYEVSERSSTPSKKADQHQKLLCHNCGYDLEGTTVEQGRLVCAECGTHQRNSTVVKTGIESHPLTIIVMFFIVVVVVVTAVALV